MQQEQRLSLAGRVHHNEQVVLDIVEELPTN